MATAPSRTRKKPTTPPAQRTAEPEVQATTGSTRTRKAASTRTQTAVDVVDIKTEIIDVTPELAQEWLDRNTINRPLRESTIELYADDMRENRWVFNGENIKRSVNGDLLDGQHRLHALIRSGKTIKMLVVSGLPRVAQESMDAGMRRTYADNFTMRGESHTSSLSAVARRVKLWQAGDRTFRGKVSFGALREMLEQYPELRRSAEVADRVYGNFRFLPPSALGTAHYLMSVLDEAETAWFFGAIERGVHLDENDPAWILRERAMMDKATGKKLDDVRAMAYLVAAWNAKRTGKRLPKQVLPFGSPIPELI